MIILNVLCEGKTEQVFVSKVLGPYLREFGIVAKNFLLSTSSVGKGGVVSYGQVRRDLSLLMRTQKDNDYEKHYFTTMFDLYALPNDFPGFSDINPDHYEYVVNIESAFAKDINDLRFLPYIELHEFETLVLCNIGALKSSYPKSVKELDKLDSAWRKECNNNPELVNNRFDTSPSHRIIRAIGNNYHYNKPESGFKATIGRIDVLRGECRHFGDWIDKLLLFTN